MSFNKHIFQTINVYMIASRQPCKPKKTMQSPACYSVQNGRNSREKATEGSLNRHLVIDLSCETHLY